MASPTPDPRQTVLITGCSPGGIGHALALEFSLLTPKPRIFATARSRATIASLVPHGIEPLSLELDSEESVRQCFTDVSELLGEGKGLDYLVNNAGRNYTVPALDVDLKEVRATFETNVVGVMHMCQVFAPLLIQARGTIVQLGSQAGVIPYVFGSVYNASKAALHAYSNTLRVELAPFDVKVIILITGGVQSNIARTHRTLPPTSLYLPLETEYVRRLTHSQEGAMETRAFARQVISKIVRRDGVRNLWGLLGDPRGRWAWVGAKVGLVWLLAGGWVWSGIFDWAFWRMFALGKLRSVGGADKKTR